MRPVRLVFLIACLTASGAAQAQQSPIPIPGVEGSFLLPDGWNPDVTGTSGDFYTWYNAPGLPVPVFGDYKVDYYFFVSLKDVVNVGDTFADGDPRGNIDGEGIQHVFQGSDYDDLFDNGQIVIGDGGVYEFSSLNLADNAKVTVDGGFLVGGESSNMSLSGKSRLELINGGDMLSFDERSAGTLTLKETTTLLIDSGSRVDLRSLNLDKGASIEGKGQISIDESAQVFGKVSPGIVSPDLPAAATFAAFAAMAPGLGNSQDDEPFNTDDLGSLMFEVGDAGRIIWNATTVLEAKKDPKTGQIFNDTLQLLGPAQFLPASELVLDFDFVPTDKDVIEFVIGNDLSGLENLSVTLAGAAVGSGYTVSLTSNGIGGGVVAPIPLPASLPIMLGGLGVLGLVRRRRGLTGKA